MILACQNISKSYGTEEILKKVNFHIEANEKAAIVGINGAGKSTLLKIIMEQITPDEGEVIVAKDKTIGYLAQYQDVTSHQTIYEEVLEARAELITKEKKLRSMEEKMNHLSGSELEKHLNDYHKLSHEFELAGGYSYRSEVVGILKGLGFSEEDFTKKMEELSGGQKTRVSLGKLLASKPDILLLDEPTNHLDLESIQWLENFFSNYKGAVIIVAHDRYFLDRIVTKVIEISQHKASVFQGNYSDYAKKKAAIRETLLKQYYNQQREIKHQEEVITKLKSFNREKSIKRAESREKMLEKVERIEKPVEEQTDIKIVLEPNVTSGNDVLTVKDLAKSYPPVQLFEHLDFEIKRGERVALIGKNGTGKTTILKIMNQLIEADAGTIKLGSNVHIGYYDQEHQLLCPEKTIFDEISDTYPQLTQTQIRNVLAAFLFTEDDVFKRIKDLSGGERGRVSLAKLMLSDANFLILDEPTNHLDITSKEILESALVQYTGTVLYVSHDRYFINQTATRILELTEKTILNYIGNYDYYLEKKETMTELLGKQEEKSVRSSQPSEVKTDWQTQKAMQARIRKIENALKKVEAEIETLEVRIAEIDEEFALPENATNSAKLGKLAGEQETCKKRLEELYEEWDQLSMQL